MAQPYARLLDHLAGRNATAVNRAQMMGSAALPALVGAAAGLSPEPDGGVARAEIAHCAACAMLAAALGPAPIGDLLAGRHGRWLRDLLPTGVAPEAGRSACCLARKQCCLVPEADRPDCRQSGGH
ncbi:MAG: hypothetical protein IRZ13_20220 [Acetobacteraceae bacterium]|nr:hypothetical protein [Acetobacteraceae bacterium]